MMTQAQKVLKERFGHTSFRPGQQEAIESVLKNQDTLVMLPTGTGKSLCYQLPTYMNEGATLIISPLLSLMQDQVESLRLNGEKRVVALNSLMPISERNRVFQQINRYKFIFTSPEMLHNEQVIHALKRTKISLFVVDEAHCISHWGTDFRPDYLTLASVKDQLEIKTTMALTATATRQVREEIIHFLGLNIHQTHQIIQSVDREEIKFIVEVCEGNKAEVLLSYLAQMTGPGIIYFTSKKLADAWADKLRNEYQLHVSSYHSDLEAEDKVKIQQQFLNNDLQIICATSAFGMGFDKEDIRFVIHYHMPASPEMYLQEVGRASRDGNQGLAILLYQPGDEKIQQRFIEESLPSREDLAQAYKSTSKKRTPDQPQEKLASYFAKHSKDINEAIQTIQKRQEIKQKQLYFMVQYVYHEACKRNYLLSYFGEKNKQQTKACCSSCGLDPQQMFEEINALNSPVRSSEMNDFILPWKEVLASLYNNL